MSDRFRHLELGDKSRVGERPGEKVYDAEFFIREAEQRYWTGDFEGCLRSASRALNLDNSQLEAWALQVRALVNLGEYEEARTWVQRGLDRAPDDPNLLMAKAIVELRNGLIDAAQGFCDTALKLGRGNSLLWADRAEIILVNNEKNAQYCIMKALEQPGAVQWKVHARAAMAFFFHKRYRNVVEHTRKALNDMPRNPFLWFLLGLSYSRLGWRAKAEDAFAEAVRIKPGYREACEALEKAKRRNLFRRFRRSLKTIIRR